MGSSPAVERPPQGESSFSVIRLLHLPLACQIFKDATLFFSRGGTPNVASVIPAMDHLDEHLTSAAISHKYDPAIRAAVAIGKKTLNRYYDRTDHSELYRIAMGMYLLTSRRLFTSC